MKSNYSVFLFRQKKNIKGPYADHILIPRVQPEVVFFLFLFLFVCLFVRLFVCFLVTYESPYFYYYNPQISASNSLYLVSYSRKLNVNLRRNCAKCVRVKVNQFRVEIAYASMGTTLFNFSCKLPLGFIAITNSHCTIIFFSIKMWVPLLSRFVPSSRRELVILLHMFCLLPGKSTSIELEHVHVKCMEFSIKSQISGNTES